MEKEYGLLPKQKNEIEIITERINKKYSQMKHQEELNYFMSEKYKANIKHYNSLMNKRYEEYMLEQFIEINYIKKEAHFPLSKPKTIYISKENHNEVSLESIKEIFNSKK